MASLEIGPLATYLDDDEISAVTRVLDEHGVELEDESDEARVIDGNVDDDLLADFLDQLEANGAGCDIYLPAEFEDVVEVAGYTVGSAYALLLALTEMRDELGIDEEKDEEEDDDYEGELEDDEDEDDPSGSLEEEERGLGLKDAQMRAIWKSFQRGAEAAIARTVALRVSRD
jgi:hypothetical protein